MKSVVVALACCVAVLASLASPATAGMPLSAGDCQDLSATKLVQCIVDEAVGPGECDVLRLASVSGSVDAAQECIPEDPTTAPVVDLIADAETSLLEDEGGEPSEGPL